MTSEISKVLPLFHAALEYVRLYDLTDDERENIDLASLAQEGGKAVWIRRHGPGDEMYGLLISDQLGYLGVKDTDNHSLPELEEFVLPATLDEMRPYAVKIIRWLLTQTIQDICGRRQVPSSVLRR